MGVIMKKLLLLSIFGLFVAINGTMNAAARPGALPVAPQPALDPHAAIVEALTDDGMDVKDARTLATATLAIADAKVDESALLQFRTLCEDIGKNSAHADALLNKSRAAALQTAGFAENIGYSMGGTAGWLLDSTCSATKTATAWTLGTGWAITKGLGKGLWNIGKYGIAKPLEYSYYGAKKVLSNKKALIIIGTLALVIAMLEGLNRYDMLPSADTRFWIGWDIDGQWDAVSQFASKQAHHVHEAYQTLPTQQSMLKNLKAWYDYLANLPQTKWDNDTLWVKTTAETITTLYQEVYGAVRAALSADARKAPDVVKELCGHYAKHSSNTAKKIALSAITNGDRAAIIDICSQWGVNIP